MASIYLVLGAVRGQLRETGLVMLELSGVAAIAVLAAVSLALDDAAGAYVLGLAWLGHAIWDYAHHRMTRVVPRAYAELCAVGDAIVAVAIVATRRASPSDTPDQPKLRCRRR
jgi:hypothetical protein